MEIENESLYIDLTRTERELVESDSNYRRNEQQLLDDIRMIEIDVILLTIE
jgi:hypothetical protein